MVGRVDKIHCFHSTVEEDVVSNWISSEAGAEQEAQDRLFVQTIDRCWGFLDLSSESCETIQGVNYMDAKDPEAFADTWVVRGAIVSAKTSESHFGQSSRASKTQAFDVRRRAPCTLFFCAGPNAGAKGQPRGSMARTLNLRASRPEEYAFFRSCVQASIRAGLDAMISERIDVVLVARVSCGIYAGPHRRRINAEFLQLVDDLLQEQVGNRKRGRYFNRVIVPMLP